MLLFTEDVELFIPPRKGRRHILRIVREMLAFEPKKRGTNIPAALSYLNHALPRRSIVFLLTDFLHEHGEIILILLLIVILTFSDLKDEG